MLIKLLTYNSRSKTAVVEFHGIDSDEIIKILVRLQQMKGTKKNDDMKGKSIPNSALKSPDLSILDESTSQTGKQQTDETETVPDSVNEDDIEKAMRESLEILRDEEDKGEK